MVIPVHEARETRLSSEELNAGDILLSLGPSRVSAAIRNVDDGRYSHGAIWTGDSVVEATDIGVTERSLASTLDEHPVRYVDVFRHHEMRSESATRVVAAAREFLNQGYGWGTLALVALIFTTARSARDRAASFRILAARLAHRFGALADAPKSVTCTQLVAEAYLRAELPLVVHAPVGGTVSWLELAYVMIELYGSRGDDESEEGGELLESRRELLILRTRLAQLLAESLGGGPPGVPLEIESALAELEAVDSCDHRMLRSIDQHQDLRVGENWRSGFVSPSQLEHSPSLVCVGRLHGEAFDFDSV